MSNSPSTLTTTNNLPVHDSKVVIVYTEWNDTIINKLVAGAKRILDQYPNKVIYELIQVPGCVEIPHIIKHYWHNHSPNVDAFIAFGCVIRGETAHFDYVCNSVTDGITHLNTSIAAPIIYGVLTVNTIQQAMDRIGGAHGHKGEEAAISALKMIDAKLKIGDRNW
jgi:6,7-dimethyl-8-ribityllumazine synthase